MGAMFGKRTSFVLACVSFCPAEPFCFIFTIFVSAVWRICSGGTEGPTSFFAILHLVQPGNSVLFGINRSTGVGFNCRLGTRQAAEPWAACRQTHDLQYWSRFGPFHSPKCPKCTVFVAQKNAGRILGACDLRICGACLSLTSVLRPKNRALWAFWRMNRSQV